MPTKRKLDSIEVSNVESSTEAAPTPSRTANGVTRQMSRNLLPAPVAVPTFQSVADFLSAYSAKKKTLDDLTNKFVDKAGEAKKAQDDILPHLADMQSLLSKKGTNHHLVIAARKQGDKIPWWTEYYKSYKDRLWGSLRTMERRIAAYRRDPTAPAPNPDPDPIPHLNNSARKALVEGNHLAVEIVTALEAGRDPTEEVAAFKAVMNAKRLDDILSAAQSEAVAKATKEFSWEDLIERLETMVPTVEDGTEHVIVDKLETGTLARRLVIFAEALRESLGTLGGATFE